MPVSSEMLRLIVEPDGTELLAAGVVLATSPLDTNENTRLDVLPRVRWPAASA